jgi:hypothetical protein
MIQNLKGRPFHIFGPDQGKVVYHAEGSVTRASKSEDLLQKLALLFLLYIDTQAIFLTHPSTPLIYSDWRTLMPKL